jgi:hypothetical protein
VQDLKPAFVVELAWSIAATEHVDVPFMQRIGTVVKRRFAEYSPTMLCSIIWAFAASGTFHADLFNMSCSKLSALVARGQLGHADVVQAATAVADSQYRHTAMLRATAEWLGVHHAHVPVASTAALLRALHAFGLAPDRLVSRIAPSLRSGLPTLGPADKGHVASAIWALGTRPGAAAHAPLMDSFLCRFDQLGGFSGGGKLLTPAHLGLFSRGVGGFLAAAPPPPAAAAAATTAALADHATVRLPDFAATPAALVDTVAGVATAGLRHDRLLHASIPLLSAAAPHLSVKQLCDASAAYSQVGVAAPRLFQALGPAIQEHLSRGSLSVEHAATLAWAFALQGLLHSPLVSSLCHAVAVRPPSLTGALPPTRKLARPHSFSKCDRGMV